MTDKIQQLIARWRAESDEIGARVEVLENAKELLPKGKIDVEINDLLTDRIRLLQCVSDLQILLMEICSEKPAYLRKIMD